MNLRLPWKVGEAKQIDIPIEAQGEYGERIVVCRVPFSKKHDAAAMAKAIVDTMNKYAESQHDIESKS